MNNPGCYLQYKKKPEAAIRLFCFHHAGGGASTFYPWLEYLSPKIEMIAIQLPGRENRFSEPLRNNIKEITDELSKGFSIYKNKPFFVFGHSMGALIAFEFIKTIHQLYFLYPCHMIISAAKAPHLLSPIRSSQLDDTNLKEQLKAYNGIDECILNNDDLLNLFLHIIKSDSSIYENYSFSKPKPFPFDILALSGTDDQSVNQEEILAWSAYTRGKFEHLSFPGQHFFIKDNQKTILKIINQIADNFP
ncbi:thioesterase II family protein [Candidatus Odyssella acanthamoebae]|uniref:thioesterase II family protein n=1 Tax=Candidatus Odyssella acanthamoebae TaxID=91604 RepID=UPI00068D74E0|nr:thioesterase domain-containing protein [Candidatus Paracaedibacter acanthamoebae]